MSTYYIERFEPQQFGKEKRLKQILPKEGQQSELEFPSDMIVLESPRKPSQALVKPRLRSGTSARNLNFKKNSHRTLKVNVSKEQEKQISDQNKIGAYQKWGIQFLMTKYKDRLIHSSNCIWKTFSKDKKQKLDSFFSTKTVGISTTTSNYETLDDRKQKIQVIEPQTKLAKFFDLLAILFTAFSLWLSPFVTTFSLGQKILYYRIILFILAFNVFDIIIILNKAIIIQGQLVLNRKEIVLQYLKHYCFGDIMTILLWILIIYDMNEMYIQQMLSFIQCIFIIIRLNARLNHYIDYLYLNGNVSEFIDLIILISTLCLFIHIFACYWTFIAYTSSQEENNWLIKNSVANSGYWVQYNTALYWATMTMVTVGYGDVTACNQIEIIFSNFTMLFSSLVFGYSINSIGMILKNISINSNNSKKSLILMNQYLNLNFVNPSISERVRHYLKHQAENEQQINQQEVHKIIDNLPIALQEELKKDIKIRTMSKIKVLNQFSQQTQNLAANSLEMIKYLPNDVIIQDEHLQETYLYYIERGEVILSESKTKQQLQSITAGGCFGQYEFFTNFDRPILAISKTFSTLYQISRTNFLKALYFNQNDFEKFHHIKDSCLFKNDTNLINEKCNVCNSNSHFSLYCSWIQYFPNLEKLVKREYFLQQYRQKFERGERAKIRTFIENKNIEQSIRNFYQAELPSQVNLNIKEDEKSSHNSESLTNLNQKNHSQIQGISDPQLNQEYLIKQNSVKYIQQKSNHIGQEKSSQNNIIIPQNKQISKNLDSQISKQLQINTIFYKSTFQTSDLIEDRLQFQNCDIDVTLNSNQYLPHNNLQIVVLHSNNKRRKSASQNYSYKYTFFFEIAKFCSKNVKYLLQSHR